LLLLLFLGSAEQEIEQAFGGRNARRQRNWRYQHDGGNKHHAAPHALTNQLCTQHQLHPTQQNLPRRSTPQHGFTLVRDGKRAMSKRRIAEKKCRCLFLTSPRMRGEVGSLLRSG
jgi:hypothetical protein